MAAPQRETVGSYVRREEAFKFEKIKGGGQRSRWGCSCGSKGPWMYLATTPNLIDQWDTHCEEMHDASVTYQEPSVN